MKLLDYNDKLSRAWSYDEKMLGVAFLVLCIQTVQATENLYEQHYKAQKQCQSKVHANQP